MKKQHKRGQHNFFVVFARAKNAIDITRAYFLLKERSLLFLQPQKIGREVIFSAVQRDNDIKLSEKKVMFTNRHHWIRSGFKLRYRKGQGRPEKTTSFRIRNVKGPNLLSFLLSH